MKRVIATPMTDSRYFLLQLQEFQGEQWVTVRDNYQCHENRLSSAIPDLIEGVTR